MRKYTVGYRRSLFTKSQPLRKKIKDRNIDFFKYKKNQTESNDQIYPAYSRDVRRPYLRYKKMKRLFTKKMTYKINAINKKETKII